MHKAIKISENLIERIDDQRNKYALGTRQNLTNTLVRKGLDYLEKNGYEALIKLATEANGCIEDMLNSTEKE